MFITRWSAFKCHVTFTGLFTFISMKPEQNLQKVSCKHRKCRLLLVAECDFTEMKSSWFSIMTTRERDLILMIKAYSICFLLRTEEHLMSHCIIGILYWVEDTKKPDARRQNLIDVRSIWSAVCGLEERPTGINVKLKRKGPQVTWKFSKSRTY